MHSSRLPSQQTSRLHVAKPIPLQGRARRPLKEPLIMSPMKAQSPRLHHREIRRMAWRISSLQKRKTLDTLVGGSPPLWNYPSTWGSYITRPRANESQVLLLTSTSREIYPMHFNVFCGQSKPVGVRLRPFHTWTEASLRFRGLPLLLRLLRERLQELQAKALVAH